MPYQLAVTPGPGYGRQPQQAGPSKGDIVREQDGIQAQRDYAQNVYAQQQAAQQAAIHQQAAQQQFGQNAYMQGIGVQQQAALAQQQAGIQEGADFRREGIAGRAAQQHVDLQAELHRTQLGHEEELRMQRMNQARSAVMADPTLADEEKQALVTQIQSGLNPLENRARQAQILHTQIQSQQAYQNTQQQAQLFNQHQQWLARGIQGQLQSVTDPQTGREQLFHVDSSGRIQALDFSQSQEMHALRMGSGVQEMAQREQMFPGQLQLQQGQIRHSELSNQQIAELMPRLREMHPLHVQALQGEIAQRSQQVQTMQQAYEQSGQQFPLHLQQMQQQLGLMGEQLRGHVQQREQQAQMFLGNLEHQELSNAQQRMVNQGLPERLAIQDQLAAQHLASAEFANSPEMRAIHQRIQAGQASHIEGQQTAQILADERARREMAHGLSTNQMAQMERHIQTLVDRDLEREPPQPQRLPSGRIETAEEARARGRAERTRVRRDEMMAPFMQQGTASTDDWTRLRGRYQEVARTRLTAGHERPQQGESPQEAQERITNRLTREHLQIPDPRPINPSEPSTMNVTQRQYVGVFTQMQERMGARARERGAAGTEDYLRDNALLHRVRNIYVAHGNLESMDPATRAEFESGLAQLRRETGMPESGQQQAPQPPQPQQPAPITSFIGNRPLTEEHLREQGSPLDRLRSGWYRR